MVTLESNLAHGTEAIAAEFAGLDARVDQLAGRISTLETSVSCLILLVERIAKSQCRTVQEVYYPKDVLTKLDSQRGTSQATTSAAAACHGSQA
jgi:hypothetical protein